MYNLMTDGSVGRILKTQVMNVLKNHKGRENAIKASRISRMLSYKDDSITSSVVRGVIHQIVQDECLPVGSCNRGYFVLTEVERKLYLDNLIKRRDRIKERILWIRNFKLN